ncbi:hypothetical protein [Bradyrhizobium sp.]|uniref:hypothetical protein n=1 Tax=Bradyrhizobium sp. TaxID=376 RepID=UPI003C7527CC
MTIDAPLDAPAVSAPLNGLLTSPILPTLLRLAIVAIGGWWLASIDAPAWTLFALVGGGMIVLGLGTALSIRVTRWGPLKRLARTHAMSEKAAARLAKPQI